MKECSKSIIRRLADSNFTRKYFVGKGIDIGGKPDPLALYIEFFVLMRGVRTWDWEDGDAQFMETIEDNSMDFVHSSHCLEHLNDPYEGLRNWFRILRPGGHLVISIPDEDLYEQGVFPSTFNADHKWTFTISKVNSWSERSINIIDLLKALDNSAEIIKVELLTSSYRFSLPRYDQTLTPIAECGIEVIIRKRTPEEVTQGRRIREINTPSREACIHLNQYRDDHSAMKKWNLDVEPFKNENDI